MRSTRVHRRAIEAYEDTISSYITEMGDAEIVEYVTKVYIDDPSPWDKVDRDIAFSIITTMGDMVTNHSEDIETNGAEYEMTFEEFAKLAIAHDVFNSMKAIEEWVAE